MDTEKEINIEQYLAEKSKEIDKEIEKNFPRFLSNDWLEKSLGKPRFAYDTKTITDSIATPVWDMLDRGGKRWRPALFLLCVEAVGGKPEKVKKYVMLLEFLHNGTLVHDDIEDSSNLRRGQPCTYLKYGVDVAINAGAGLYFLPLMMVRDDPHLSTEQKNKVFELWLHEILRCHVGQGMDILWHKGLKSDISEEEYLQMCTYKTGTLARLSTRLGGFLGGGNTEQIEKLGKFGESIGVAFQIQDDILNLVGEEFSKGKGVGEDIHEGKRTIMVLYALNKANEKDKKRLLEILNAHPSDEKTIVEAIEIIKKHGSIEYARARAKELVEKSWKEVESVLPESEAKNILHAFASFLINRKV